MDYQHTPTLDTDDSFQDITTEEEEDFPTATLKDDIWLEDQSQIDIYVFMNSHSHISCVPTPVHTAWTRYPTLQKLHHIILQDHGPQ